MGEYLEALEELIQAQQNFDNAHPEYIDAALYQLKAAEEKLSAILKEKKELPLAHQTLGAMLKGVY